MTEHSFSYDLLEDGQSLVTLVQWRSRLQRDAKEALSVFHDRLEIFQKRAWEAMGRGFSADAVKQRLLALELDLREAIDGMPRGAGVFSSSADRTRAFEATCLLISTLQGRLADLQLTVMPCESVGNASDRMLETELSLMRQRLLTARQAARELCMREAEAECSALLEQIDGLLAQRSRSLQVHREQQMLVSSLVQYAATDFCDRVSEEADFENDGASASPTAILRSVGELRDRVERTLRELARFENDGSFANGKDLL